MLKEICGNNNHFRTQKGQLFKPLKGKENSLTPQWESVGEMKTKLNSLPYFNISNELSKQQISLGSQMSEQSTFQVNNLNSQSFFASQFEQESPSLYTNKKKYSANLLAHKNLNGNNNLQYQSNQQNQLGFTSTVQSQENIDHSTQKTSYANNNSFYSSYPIFQNNNDHLQFDSSLQNFQLFNEKSMDLLMKEQEAKLTYTSLIQSEWNYLVELLNKFYLKVHSYLQICLEKKQDNFSILYDSFKQSTLSFRNTFEYYSMPSKNYEQTQQINSQVNQIDTLSSQIYNLLEQNSKEEIQKEFIDLLRLSFEQETKLYNFSHKFFEQAQNEREFNLNRINESLSDQQVKLKLELPDNSLKEKVEKKESIQSYCADYMNRDTECVSQQITMLSQQRDNQDYNSNSSQQLSRNLHPIIKQSQQVDFFKDDILQQNNQQENSNHANQSNDELELHHFRSVKSTSAQNESSKKSNQNKELLIFNDTGSVHLSVSKFTNTQINPFSQEDTMGNFMFFGEQTNNFESTLTENNPKLCNLFNNGNNNQIKLKNVNQHFGINYDSDSLSNTLFSNLLTNNRQNSVQQQIPTNKLSFDKFHNSNIDTLTSKTQNTFDEGLNIIKDINTDGESSNYQSSSQGSQQRENHLWSCVNQTNQIGLSFSKQNEEEKQTGNEHVFQKKSLTKTENKNNNIFSDRELKKLRGQLEKSQCEDYPEEELEQSNFSKRIGRYSNKRNLLMKRGQNDSSLKVNSNSENNKLKGVIHSLESQHQSYEKNHTSKKFESFNYQTQQKPNERSNSECSSKNQRPINKTQLDSSLKMHTFSERHLTNGQLHQISVELEQEGFVLQKSKSVSQNKSFLDRNLNLNQLSRKISLSQKGRDQINLNGKYSSCLFTSKNLDYLEKMKKVQTFELMDNSNSKIINCCYGGGNLFIFSTSDSILLVFDVKDNKVIEKQASKIMIDKIINLDNRYLALVSFQSPNIKIFDLKTFSVTKMLVSGSSPVTEIMPIHKQGSDSISSLDQFLVATNQDGSMSVWQEWLLTHKKQNQHPIKFLTSTSDFSCLIAVDSVNSLLVFDIIYSQKKQVNELKLKQTVSHSNFNCSQHNSNQSITSLSYLNGSQFLVLGYGNGIITIVNINNLNVVRTIEFSKFPIQSTLLIEDLQNNFAIIASSQQEENLRIFKSQSNSIETLQIPFKQIISNQPPYRSDQIFFIERISSQYSKDSPQSEYPLLFTLDAQKQSFSLWSHSENLNE